jgi:hypothetical protein
MTTPKRIALAFGCLLLGFAAFAILEVAPTLIRYGTGPGMRAMEMMPAYLAVAIAGWLLSIPFVIAFKDADGWRFWATLVIGTAIGPVFLLGSRFGYGRTNKLARRWRRGCHVAIDRLPHHRLLLVDPQAVQQKRAS